MNVCEGDTSPFLEVTDVSFDSVCALLYLVNANPRILERLSTLGERIINGSNPRRASTLCSAWNLLNHLYSQACYLPLEEAINECFALLDEQPKAKDFPDEATRVSQAMRVACRDALSETPFFASSPASPVTPLSLVVNKSLEGAQRPVKIFMDGVFDLVHSGHFNALRQAASMGDELYVGINSDEETRAAKGTYPIYPSEERARIVKACKWVKDVIVDVPYTITLDFLKSTGCDFVAHGDDLVYDANGNDCYAEIKKAGKMKMFRRTEGVSTTTLVARLLAVAEMTNPNVKLMDTPVAASAMVSSLLGKQSRATCRLNFLGSELSLPSDTTTAISPSSSNSPSSLGIDQTLMSTKRLCDFMGLPRRPSKDQRVVYTAGSFDVFHAGHVAALEAAKEKGDFLIVGVFDDATVRDLKGSLYPIQSMLERALCVIAMECVDEVIIGAPLHVSDFLLKEFRVDVVVGGERSVSKATEGCDEGNSGSKCQKNMTGKGFNTPMLSSEIIFNRILNNRKRLEESIKLRKAKEAQVYTEFVSGTKLRPGDTEH